MRKRIATLLLCVLAAGCVTVYGPMTISGGFEEKELEPGIWRVLFSGNGYTSYETVQTYWLYRCSDLAIENGYDGFEVLSNMRFVEAGPRGPVRVASSGMVYIPMYYDTAPKPSLEGDIQLLHGPITPVPGRVFDAAALQEKLRPLVMGEKCDGNVCPHVHRYVYPDGTQPAQPADEKP